jgi:hypothetical protein
MPSRATADCRHVTFPSQEPTGGGRMKLALMTVSRLTRPTISEPRVKSLRLKLRPLCFAMNRLSHSNLFWRFLNHFPFHN